MSDNITILDFGGTPRVVATREAGGAHYQLMAPYQQNRSDTFTGAANGTTVDVSLIPCSRFGIQVKGTGAAPSAWNVVLEGSLNNVQFTTLLTHTNTNPNTPDGSLWLQALAAPVKYFRSRCVSITLGSATNVVVTIIGEAGS